MTFDSSTSKPVGIDSASMFPDRVETRLTEKIQDTLGAAILAGANIDSVTYDDAAGTVTINAATQGGGGGGGSVAWADVSGKPSTFAPDPEAVDDRVAALLVAGSNVTLTYDDAANTLTVAAAGGGGGSTPDTGWRDLTADAVTAGLPSNGGNLILIRRIGDVVHGQFKIGAVGTYSAPTPIPSDFAPIQRFSQVMWTSGAVGSVDNDVNVQENGFLWFRGTGGAATSGAATWVCDATFPTSMPGVAYP